MRGGQANRARAGAAIGGALGAASKRKPVRGAMKRKAGGSIASRIGAGMKRRKAAGAKKKMGAGLAGAIKKKQSARKKQPRNPKSKAMMGAFGRALGR